MECVLCDRDSYKIVHDIGVLNIQNLVKITSQENKIDPGLSTTMHHICINKKIKVIWRRLGSVIIYNDFI